METDKVLFVDDDENLLRGVRRTMRGKFNMSIAVGGEQALKTLAEDGPFAVCIADMRMPGMTGVELLETISKKHPETVGIMLTGNADQGTAIEAINRGSIFRFFNKPCDDALLESGIRAALRQYQLITAERNLIEQSLAGSIKVLTDVLAQLNPTIFGRSMRVKRWCDQASSAIEYPQPWELGLAALLCPIGMVSLPPDLLSRMTGDKPLQPLERDIVKRTPEVAARLIANIPRLENVAEIVGMQNRNFDGTGFPDKGPAGMDIPLGARVLRILNSLAERTQSDTLVTQDFDELLYHKHRYDLDLLSRLRSQLATVDSVYDETIYPDGQELTIAIKELRVGDYLLTDLETTENRILLTHGNFISEVQLQRLRIFERIHKFHEPIDVRRGGSGLKRSTDSPKPAPAGKAGSAATSSTTATPHSQAAPSVGPSSHAQEPKG
ncbi:HD domain-containing phosphohydrolase [Thalassospira sp. TSL5-1]|uniref:HD domain-containing phosphohydrolase n=1 Tax=Thalassospira sp. TSL5-1 TaxID=1544451 RepID=UPI000938D63E|nr:HD domain-containing phosphohydrolase [Thalassospira sp. TSL5-1]